MTNLVFLFLGAFLASAQTAPVANSLPAQTTGVNRPAANVPVCGSGDALFLSGTNKAPKPGIYSNTGSDLYFYEPETKTLKHLSSFSLNGSPFSTVTDIAVAPDGSMFAMDWDTIYEVSPMTGELQTLCTSWANPVGLEFMPDGRMIIASMGIELLDLKQNMLSNSIPSAQIDGDVAYSSFGGQFVFGFSAGELLKFDLSTNQVASEGQTGLLNVFGLAAKDDRLYAFTADGAVSAVNIFNKTFNVVDNQPHEWWGAAWY